MKITDHQINELNEQIAIAADDRDVNNGNASHVYAVQWPRTPGGPDTTGVTIGFQHGPVKENGINGLTNEALMAIVIDRLRGFQSGKFACRENAIALTKMEEALHWLQSRTRARLARGVEGTNQV